MTEYATFNDQPEQLKFTKPDPQREEYVADTGDITYRISRNDQGLWEVKVAAHVGDAPPIAETVGTWAEALALVDFVKKEIERGMVQATFNDPPEQAKSEKQLKREQGEAELQAILDKPWKELTWKERLLKGTIYGVGGAAVAVGAAFTYMNTRPPGDSSWRASSGSGWNYSPPSELQRWQERAAAQQQQQQWMPWMSQGQLNPYDGQTYYPIHYGTRF